MKTRSSGMKDRSAAVAAAAAAAAAPIPRATRSSTGSARGTACDSPRSKPCGVRRKTGSPPKTAGKPKNATRSQACEPFPPEHAQDPAIPPLDKSWVEQERTCFERERKIDHLIELPTEETSTYLDSKGRPKFDDRYVMESQRKPPIGERHPKIIAARKNGTLTPELERYYEQLHPKVNIPLAGIPSHPAFADRLERPETSQGASSRADADFDFVRLWGVSARDRQRRPLFREAIHRVQVGTE